MPYTLSDKARKQRSKAGSVSSPAKAASGAKGGKVSSDAKAEAARRNGTKGGRPRTQAGSNSSAL